MGIRICEVDPRYISFLNALDSRVSLEHPGRKARKFVGVVLDVGGVNYYAPMSSPKPKHSRISSAALDVYKIDDGKLGVININNMIPVLSCAIVPVNISSISDEKYRLLLENQARNIKIESEKILKKANKLYKAVGRDNVSSSLKNRCCDFKLLEQHYQNYESQR